MDSEVFQLHLDRPTQTRLGHRPDLRPDVDDHMGVAVILYQAVPLCPHILGYFRDDVPPEEHAVLYAECEECGVVTAVYQRANLPGFGLSADECG